MAGPYETWITRLRPSWMGPKAKAFLGAIGAVLGDKTTDETEASLLEEIPSTATDPASIALALSERQLEAGPAFSVEVQQALADAAPSLNRLRGRPLGMLVALYYAGFPGAVLVQQNGLAFYLGGSPVLADLLGIGIAQPAWFTITTLPSANPSIPVSTDGKAAIPVNTIPWSGFAGSPMDAIGNQFNSRFAILFPASAGDPQLNIAENLARIQRIIKSWKPAKATCSKIVVVNSGIVYGWPPRYYGDGAVYGGSTTTYAAE